MATFEVQVEALTGIAIGASSNPTQDELTQFLNDGVLEVTSRWLTIHPNDVKLFIRVSGEVTSNGSEKVDRAKIVSVIREADVNDDWRQCRYISPNLQARVVDADSLQFASSYNPAYTVLEDGAISVFPTPGSTTKAFKVYYINNNPRGSDDNAVAYGSTGLAFFPKDKVYLVVLYAAIKSLEAKMGEYTIDEEDLELVTLISSNLATLKQQYDSDFAVGASAQAGRQQARA